MSRIWIGRADTPLAFLDKTKLVSSRSRQSIIVDGRLTALILRSAAAAAWDLRASGFGGGCEGRCWVLPIEARGWSVLGTKVCPPVWLDDLEQIDPMFELVRCLFERLTGLDQRTGALAVGFELQYYNYQVLRCDYCDRETGSCEHYQLCTPRVQFARECVHGNNLATY